MKKEDWLKISELEALSGVSRRNIHFYLQEGLLPQPMKTGKTMAYYGHHHLERLRFIQEARRKGLPLAAIRDSLKTSGGRLPSSVTQQGRDLPASSSGPSRKARSRRTREQILALGSRFFRTKGFKQTRVSDITTAMNIGKGTFYFYFKDKTELFLECVPRIFNELFAAGWDRIRRIDDPLVRLETRASMVMPVLSEFCAILQLSREAVEEADPKLTALGEQVFRSIRRPIAADIEKGIRAGVFRKMDADIAATLLIGVMESLQDLHGIDGQSLTPEIWQQVSAFITAGLVKGS